MADFSFLKNAQTKEWVVSAPRRSKRPDSANGHIPVCPFCGLHEKSLYQIGEGEKWQVKVIPNKFPFAPIHELVIHSPFHTKNFEELPLTHTELILQTYRRQYNEHSHKGQVYIFHNRGRLAGESIKHPHTQIAVIPEKVYLDIPPLRSVVGDRKESLTTDHFTLFCPVSSHWPDEVWVAPKKKSEKTFGEITDEEINDLSHTLFSLITIFQARYNHDFHFNFYIYPGHDWYLRLIPRRKMLGGFEVGTGVMVNTEKPGETMQFLKEHFHAPDIVRIMREHIADYHHNV